MFAFREKLIIFRHLTLRFFVLCLGSFMTSGRHDPRPPAPGDFWFSPGAFFLGEKEKIRMGEPEKGRRIHYSSPGNAKHLLTTAFKPWF